MEKLSLVGKRFHYLEVVKQMPSENGSSMWLCRCDCGSEVVLAGKNLKYGSYKTCGCRKKKPLKIYIEDNVERDPITKCWIWGSRRKSGGYGCISIKNKTHAIHRVSYAVFIGRIPEGMLVCHKCDNKLCCNPKHLFLGTHEENMKDMVKKSRQAKGSKNGFSKLSKKDVVEILKLKKEGLSARDLASRYQTCMSNIKSIALGKTWKHVE